MALIESDDGVVASLLQEIIRLIESAGGYLRKELRIRCQSGAFSLHSSLTPNDQSVLLYIPLHCIPSAEDFFIKFSGGRLECEPKSDEVPEAQVRLMELQTAVFNECDKVSEFERNSARIALLDKPRLRDMLNSAKGNYIRPLRVDESIEDRICQAFLMTRLLGEWGGRKKLLMPIIDYGNHHPNAPSVIKTQEGRNEAPGLALANAQPLPGSDEVFYRYGTMDSFETFMRYAYVDENTWFTQSVPLTMSMPEDLEINVLAKKYDPSLSDPAELPESLRDVASYLPMRNVRQGRIMTLSWLLIPSPDKAPRALRRSLEFAFLGFEWRRRQHLPLAQLVANAESRIIGANRQFLSSLESELQAAGADFCAHPAARELLRLISSVGQFIDRYEASVRMLPILSHHAADGPIVS